MIKSIEDFQINLISYPELVYDLEGSLDAGDFENKELIERWYKFWGPLEILYATKGENVSIESANKYVLDMQSFLKEILSKETSLPENLDKGLCE